MTVFDFGVLIVVLVFASTAMAAEPWFRQSALVPRLLVGAAIVRQSLPPPWAAYLDGVLHPVPAPAVPAGAKARPSKV